ncbi:unnamed protein product, partial [Onchocerca ochengi]|uniref:non-specific serine/threonine protein kinase n=1 Tax=Onchocerca ochengi TaxID=42157 RepID=A0A182E5Y4_ONCOC
AVEKTLSTGHENVLLLAEVHKRLAIYAEKKLLLLEDYCSSETFKVKKTAIKKWEEELRAIREERLQAVRQGKMVEQGKLLEEKRIQKEKMSEEKELVQYCNDRNMLILTALDAYLAALELDASAADIPYRILPFFVKAKYNENLLEPLKASCTLRNFPRNDLDSIVRLSIPRPSAFALLYQLSACDDRFSRSTASIADSVLLNEAENLRNVPIPAIEQPAIDIVFQLTDDSSQLITFINIEPVVTIADGITQPTIVTVIGSDGKVRKLIFKNEDLRQDSLVEQLFTVVNILLMNEDKTFPLRTYHVMPINSSAGIIEFCLGTVSLCNYICGADRKSGMHKKLYPLEMTAAAARFKLSEARTNQSNLVETYEEICKGIHPVFRHFFYDSFPDPLEWFSRIKDYTISLARWSIVGYIVGLGDRHLNNIMIEKETGRLLHIDLGMVFEFGKRNLLIPERVPFRLTREMIDPILIEGVNGKFKNVAVDTLDRLRKNSQVLIGLALVLLNDPLMKYLGGEKGSHSATLAICRLHDKLAGIENRIYMDPSQQVSHLIKEASNPENLARMFAGWMPFL